MSVALIVTIGFLIVIWLLDDIRRTLHRLIALTPDPPDDD
jgi:hypothetical protein